jgi:thiamine pyrophosphate-dependent acetolactate synthase large subunit-like protein
MNKVEAIKALMQHVAADDLVVCCNGMIGRELYTYGERPANFYMIGSMGLGLSIGLGLALAQPNKRVIVLDNQTHGSTGGQRTISGEVHLEDVAVAAGYLTSRRADSVETFATALGAAFSEPGPTMVLGVVEGGTIKGIGRVKETPPELTARFVEEARR